jgi:hypothetical protein
MESFNTSKNQRPRRKRTGYATRFARQPMADIASLKFRRRAAGN